MYLRGRGGQKKEEIEIERVGGSGREKMRDEGTIKENKRGK